MLNSVYPENCLNTEKDLRFIYPQGKHMSARFRLSIVLPCILSIMERQLLKIISIINVPAGFNYVFTCTLFYYVRL